MVVLAAAGVCYNPPIPRAYDTCHPRSSRPVKAAFMAIEFRCIRCRQRLRVPEEDAGKRARCPSCNAVVDIPDSIDEAAAPIIMSREKSDVIDFELFGNDIQYVEITLDPGEVTVARLENMLYMSPGIAVEMAAHAPSESDSNSGILGRLSQVGRRILTGSSIPMTAFCNVAEQREVVAFAPDRPGRLVPLHMEEHDQQVYCQDSSILCVARGIEISDIEIAGLPDSVSMQQVCGDGVVVLQSAGALFHRELKKDHRINVRAQSIVAMTPKVRVTPHECAGSEEQLQISSVTGPGKIWLMSLVSDT